MKKVLLVSGSLPPIRCGVGYYTARLSRELAANSLDFSLLSTKGVDKNTPVPLATVPNWKIRALPKIFEEISSSKAEIIHIQYPAVGYSRQLGINLLPYVIRVLKPRLKIVITLHEYHQSRWIGRWRNRITVWPAHKVIVSNQPDVNALKNLGRKVSVIPIGSNIEMTPRRPEFFKKIMKSLVLDAKGRTIIFFGYAFPNKKLEVLLDAMDEPQLNDHQLLLLGSFGNNTAYQRMLEDKIIKLNRTKIRVGVTGFLDSKDASAILQECKYFVLPNGRPLSAKSGTAIAAIQNRMVLVSRGSKNHPEDTAPFANLKNCYLLEDVSPQTIAGAIEHLENSPNEVRSILKGAEKLQKYFSWPNIVKAHLKLYEELL